MPFGRDHAHVTVRLIDFEDLVKNQYVVTTQFCFRAGPAERRADAILLVNGLPLVLIEEKTPVRRLIRPSARSPITCPIWTGTRWARPPHAWPCCSRRQSGSRPSVQTSPSITAARWSPTASRGWS